MYREFQKEQNTPPTRFLAMSVTLVPEGDVVHGGTIKRAKALRDAACMLAKVRELITAAGNAGATTELFEILFRLVTTLPHVDTRCRHGGTALNYTVENGTVDDARALLAVGANAGKCSHLVWR